MFTSQETHSTKDDVQVWDAHFQRNLFYAHETNSSRRILLGFNSDLNVNVEASEADPEGHILLLM